MKGWMGGGVSVAVLVLLLAAPPAFAAIALDPNNGPFAVGESIDFNIAGGEMVFDSSVGDLGALVGFDGSVGGGTIITSNPNYPSSAYSFGLRWTVPLLEDTSDFVGTSGEFGADGPNAIVWELVDLENSETVLLSGEVLDSPGNDYDFIVGELEFVAPGKLFPADGGGLNGLIGLSVTGGLLAPQFTPEARMTFEMFIQPNPMSFGGDLYTPGAGSVTIFAVPEPASLALFGGVLLVAVRRRLT